MTASAPAPVPGRPSRAYTRIDWKTAARQIAAGRSAEEAATAIGVDEDRLWRHWHRSQRFRDYVHACLERRRGLTGLQLDSAAPAAALARCQTPDSLALDAATLAMLSAGSLQVQPAEPAAAPASIGQRVAALGEAGRRARKRSAKPSAAKSPAAPASEPVADEVPAPRVVTVRRLTMHRVTTPAQLPTPQPAARPATALPAPALPAPAVTARNGPERAETVPNGPERAETGENGQQRTAPDPMQHDDDSPPPLFRARPDFITDLPSPDFPDGIPYARNSPE